MTNPDPLEALRKQIENILDGVWHSRSVSDVLPEIMELVTAYAATVEREAVEDTIWKIMSTKTEALFDKGDLFTKRKPIEDAIIGIIGYEKYKALQEAVDAPLAALQGPQDSI